EIRDVERDDLGRATALELVRVEAVPGADVEAPLAPHVRERDRRQGVAQVEPPARHRTVLHIDRVVPPERVEALLDALLRHGAAPYPGFTDRHGAIAPDDRGRSLAT